MEETLDLMTKIASLLNIILVPLIAWGYRSDKKNTSDALKRHEERIEKNEDALNLKTSFRLFMSLSSILCRR